MGFSITPEWVARLRQDLEKWDDRVRQGRRDYREWEQWTWPELAPPPLKYTGDVTERVSIRNRDEAQVLHCDKQGR